MATPIAIAVIEDEGRFLIGQRPEKVPLAGLWEFPGGKIEAGETAEQAAVREAREEAGMTVEPLFRYPEHVQQYDHGRVHLIFVACRLAHEESSEPNPPFHWIPREQLLDYAFPAGNRNLLKLLTNF